MGAGAPEKPSKRLQRGIKILVLTTLKKGPTLDPPKQHQKNRHKHSIWRLWRPNDPQSAPRGSPKGSQNPSKIIKKSSLSRRGLPQATSHLPEGTPPPQKKGPKIHRILHEFRSTFWQSTATHRASKTQKKNGGRSVLYLLLWGERLRRQSTGYSLSLQNSNKQNGERSLLYF